MDTFRVENMSMRSLLKRRLNGKGKKIILEFEGIYQQAQVYLNGQLTGTNIYGYSNFYVPLEG